MKRGDNRRPSGSQLAAAIRQGDRASLARGITLVESTRPEDFHAQRELIEALLPFSGGSLRLGITGTPGAGKSTFIESLGLALCNRGKKLTVLAIDPSSSLSGGSILADRTRMLKLSRHPLAFIRPSASRGQLGGLHHAAGEVIILFEAFGADIVILETVGVGQTEISVRDVVDMVFLLTVTGGGDELQGIKRGILELVDTVVVHKADGDNEAPALDLARDYRKLLPLIRCSTRDWERPVIAVSSLTGHGIPQCMEEIARFAAYIGQSGILQERRGAQHMRWFEDRLQARALSTLYASEDFHRLVEKLKKVVLSRVSSPLRAVDEAEQFLRYRLAGPMPKRKKSPPEE